MYEYSAKVIRVYDGDTVTVKFDLGFDIHVQETVHLFGINAPEIRGIKQKSGKISRDKLRALILDKNVIVKTYKNKKSKYGKYLTDIYIKTETGLLCVNDWLVSKQLANYRTY